MFFLKLNILCNYSEKEESTVKVDKSLVQNHPNKEFLRLWIRECRFNMCGNI